MGVIVVLGGCFRQSDSPETQAIHAYELGASFQKLGGISKAEKAYLNAIALNPQFAEAYAELGFIEHLRGRYEPAMLYLEQALSLDPDLAVAYNYRGMIYYEGGASTMALLNFTRAIQIDPTLGEALYNRASVYLLMDNMESAVDDMSSLIEVRPGVPRYFFERAQLRALMGNASGAKMDLEQVFTLTDEEEMTLKAKVLLATIREAEE